MERVLRPEGKLIISSFNPYGLWAINRYFNDVNLPLNGANWVALARFKDWCKLLDLEIVGGEFLAFYPAMNSPKWQKSSHGYKMVCGGGCLRLGLSIVCPL